MPIRLVVGCFGKCAGVYGCFLLQRRQSQPLAGLRCLRRKRLILNHLPVQRLGFGISALRSMHLCQRIPRAGSDGLIGILVNDKAIPIRGRIRFGQRKEKHVAEFVAQLGPLASDAGLRFFCPGHVRNIQRRRPRSIPRVALVLISAGLRPARFHHCGLKSLKASPIGREWPFSPNTLEREQGVLASGGVAIVQKPCLNAGSFTKYASPLIALHRELSASGYGRVAKTLPGSPCGHSALFILPSSYPRTFDGSNGSPEILCTKTSQVEQRVGLGKFRSNGCVRPIHLGAPSHVPQCYPRYQLFPSRLATNVGRGRIEVCRSAHIIVGLVAEELGITVIGLATHVVRSEILVVQQHVEALFGFIQLIRGAEQASVRQLHFRSVLEVLAIAAHASYQNKRSLRIAGIDTEHERLAKFCGIAQLIDRAMAGYVGVGGSGFLVLAIGFKNLPEQELGTAGKIFILCFWDAHPERLGGIGPLALLYVQLGES